MLNLPNRHYNALDDSESNANFGKSVFMKRFKFFLNPGEQDSSNEDRERTPNDGARGRGAKSGAGISFGKGVFQG